jgi:GNAT superfamily N-acetyltransferase
MTPLRSLGYSTDLALLQRQGGLVEERDGYVVARMPANPTYHWGNCLIVREAPAPGTLADWLDVFAEEHPGAGHVAIGLDDPSSDPDPAEAVPLGVEIERDMVLTARASEPPDVPDGVELVHVRPDDDAAWERLVELEMTDDLVGTPDQHRHFLRRRYAGHRALVREGHGTWCAAVLDDGSPVATLGIFDAGGGRARYQQVMTHPDHRRQGLAGALVRFAGAFAVDSLGARELVIVADLYGPAIGVYRSAGFSDHQAQSALYRAGSQPRS